MYLIVNPGSTSYKYALYTQNACVLSAQYQKKGKGFVFSTTVHGEHQEAPCTKHVFLHSPNHFLAYVHQTLGHQPTAINAVGVRIVHGGAHYQGPVKITTPVLKHIKALIPFAPIHNAIAVEHIQQWRSLLPRTPFIAHFDTAFHHTIPFHARIPALPATLNKGYYLQKYGFHGLSCESILELLPTYHGTLPRRLVLCHFGGGCSITAIAEGKSLDTTMGLTPLTGLPMSTRSGDVGADMLLHLLQTTKHTPDSLAHALNYQSGFLGLSGSSADMRVLRRERDEGNVMADLTITHFIHHAVMTIGSYITLLGGIDALVFTAGIGEGSTSMRAQIVEALGYHGLRLHQGYNKRHHTTISTPSSSAAIYVLPTDEMGYMARSTHAFITKRH